jgi:hypothetical protein
MILCPRQSGAQAAKVTIKSNTVQEVMLYHRTRLRLSEISPLPETGGQPMHSTHLYTADLMRVVRRYYHIGGSTENVNVVSIPSRSIYVSFLPSVLYLSCVRRGLETWYQSLVKGVVPTVEIKMFRNLTYGGGKTFPRRVEHSRKKYIMFYYVCLE